MQKIFPASRNMKEFEQFLESSYEIGVFLEIHISMLKSVQRLAEQRGKKMIYHMDLIHGIKNDDFGTEYVCQEYNPYGLISTKINVILRAKKKGVKAIQRMFLIDSGALKKSLKLIEKTQPDCIELLPGAMPWVIEEVYSKVNIPIMAGGFIRTKEDVENAFKAGAVGITTSNMELWRSFSQE
ncbi:glycerol-3-phosphate responsive antiterminator [Bacillus sp. CECT 9360]|uniref:glycerol-3-phosphate responsive antiterminator n=1 Tax=Bacillus sp. CECT 9360 TaxID=2845821 RepID=UPI001E360C81|nr:glycerol-3-phosphate responsive antiterminator [Bacillus sp. CECT 9360]CAH0347297.1 Glycerol uptake operon antiterminator regulatory protein [Bacillus sp. CECT 9360]